MRVIKDIEKSQEPNIALIVTFDDDSTVSISTYTFIDFVKKYKCCADIVLAIMLRANPHDPRDYVLKASIDIIKSGTCLGIIGTAANHFCKDVDFGMYDLERYVGQFIEAY